MRSPGQVLLLGCYELGHQPLTLATPYAALTKAGFSPRAIDLALDPLNREAVAAARLVAISVPMHTALRIAIDVAARVRALNPAAHLCFYGLYAALHAEELVTGPADTAIGGEIEAPLVALAGAIERGGDEPPRGVSSARQFAGSHIVRGHALLPDRSGLPDLDRYAALIDADGPRAAGYIESTRGCKHLCRHCPVVPIYDGRFLALPVDVVLADARQQIEAGATHLTFADPDYLNGPSHALRVARALHRAHPSVTFDFTAKVEHLLQHAAMLPELRALGAVFVVSALESLSPEVLARLDKGHEPSDVDRLLEVLDDAALPLRPTFLPFTPWTTRTDVAELLRWIETNDLIEHIDPIQLTIRLLVPPGSRLLELPAGVGWPGPFDPTSLSHQWRHRDPSMDELPPILRDRVEKGARDDEPSSVTFAALRQLTSEVLGLPAEPQAARRGPRRDRPPRLAEAWFC